jgi:glycosyltransferase involved in cell wall biosynthesis
VRLENRPDLLLYEVGRAPRIVGEEALGLPKDATRLARLSSRASRRMLRLLPIPRLRWADRALGGVDVFHHTAPVLPPIRRAKQTVAVARIPAGGSPEEEPFAHALARVDAALVFSASCKKRLRDRYGLGDERVHQVAVGCEHWRRDLGKLPDRDEIPRILALGPLQSGRRHLRLLKAFELLIESGVQAHLHVVGGSGDEEKDFERVVADSKLRLRIVRERSLPERDLAALVARSSVLVHLVEDAETPVTPLEAFSMGTPVVASRLPAYEESLGGLAELVVNGQIDHASDLLMEAIQRALRSAVDPSACAIRVRHAGAFTWERNARETVAAWGAILEREGVRSSPP